MQVLLPHAVIKMELDFLNVRIIGLLFSIAFTSVNSLFIFCLFSYAYFLMLILLCLFSYVFFLMLIFLTASISASVKEYSLLPASASASLLTNVLTQLSLLWDLIFFHSLIGTAAAAVYVSNTDLYPTALLDKFSFIA